MQKSKVFLGALAVLSGVLLSAAVASAYDIKRDYCGVIIQAKFCKCAFHNQGCASIGMTQSQANAFIQKGFNEWVASKTPKPAAPAPTPVPPTPTPQPSEPTPPPKPTNEPTNVNAAVGECGPTGVKKDGACECGSGHAVDPKTKKCREFVTCSAEQHMTRKGPFECGCEKLYRLTKDKSDCIFDGARGISMSTENIDKFQATVEGLKPDESGLFEGVLRNGKPIRIGVLRLPDGSFIFTDDGRNYYDDPSKTAKPGFFGRLNEGWADLTRGVRGVFGIGRYTGPDTAGPGGRAAQLEGQRALDAATAALANLKNDVDTPEERTEKAYDIIDKWADRFKDVLAKPALETRGVQIEAYKEQALKELKDKLKDLTGIPVSTIEKLLKKEFLDVAGLGKEDVIKKLVTAPGDAVLTLTRELRADSFAKGARQYIEERKAGKNPDQIVNLLSRGELPELDLASSIKGVGQIFAREALFSSYEEAYQRYRLTSQLSGK